MPIAPHARKHSFAKEENKSVPLLPIADLSAKRERMQQILASKLDPTARGCVALPSDSKCPRSFGNQRQLMLSALLSSHLLQTRLQPLSHLDCNAMLQFKHVDRLLPMDRPRRTVKLDKASCSRLTSSSKSLNSDECLSLPQSDHGQGTVWCLQDEAKRSADLKRRLDGLFGLGPHAAYGSVFDAAFGFRNESVPEWRRDEFRISVHIRHFDPTQTGLSMGTARMYEKAISEAAQANKGRPCALLVASDRRPALNLMKSVAKRVGCRFMMSPRSVEVRDWSAEHGVDVGEVALRDVFLLAHGHVLVGTWGSSLTIIIQQLIAARSTGNLPTVVYCDQSVRRCMKPLPLLTDERNAWYVTLESNGAGRIYSTEAMSAASEWSEWQQLQKASALREALGDTSMATTGAHRGGDGLACSVSLLKQGSKAKCVLGSTFGCFPGGRVMWVFKGCRGQFRCSDSVIPCGFPRQSPGVHNCTCLTEQWPTEHETVAALKAVKWPSRPPTLTVGLAAIISGNRESVRFQQTYHAVRGIGFEAAHVPAAMPSQYDSLQAMLGDLFGDSNRIPTKMSPHELGLLISHKRALDLIARSSYKWGAVFEDDAYLHEAVSSHQAGHMMERIFSAIDARAGLYWRQSTPPVVYLGGCAPRCSILDDQKERDAKWTRATLGLPISLFRTGQCQAYCTHAYALQREHATNFFADVFDCRKGSPNCGAECTYRPCFMDWAMTRYFQRGREAWIVGGGLRSPWRDDHHGLFIQNRSKELGNDVSGTNLGARYRWSTPAQQCPQASDGASGATATQQPLRKVIIAVRWSGRLGNLLFELGALLGLSARLQAIAPTEAITFRPPSTEEVPAKLLFEQFDLSRLVRQLPSIRDGGAKGFGVAYADELRSCTACTYTVRERRANTHEEAELARLESWVKAPPANCTVGLVDLNGYFQSFKYFQAIDAAVRAALDVPSSEATTRDAGRILTAARQSLPRSGVWKLVGVQVRLGDMRTNKHFSELYAPATWEYYRAAMRELTTRLREGGGVAGVAFIVTAGGSIGSNAADVADARKHLAAAAEHVFFSDATSPYVDLAVLRACDGLITGPSTFGWWAAYLSKLPARGLAIVPRHVFSPRLPKHHQLIRGFNPPDYFPPDFLVLANDGSGAAAMAAPPPIMPDGLNHTTSPRRARHEPRPPTRNGLLQAKVATSAGELAASPKLSGGGGGGRAGGGGGGGARSHPRHVKVYSSKRAAPRPLVVEPTFWARIGEGFLMSLPWIGASTLFAVAVLIRFVR